MFARVRVSRSLTSTSVYACFQRSITYFDSRGRSKRTEQNSSVYPRNSIDPLAYSATIGARDIPLVFSRSIFSSFPPSLVVSSRRLSGRRDFCRTLVKEDTHEIGLPNHARVKLLGEIFFGKNPKASFRVDPATRSDRSVEPRIAFFLSRSDESPSVLALGHLSLIKNALKTRPMYKNQKSRRRCSRSVV